MKMAVARLSWLILIFKGAKMENHSALRNRKMTADMAFVYIATGQSATVAVQSLKPL